MTTEAQSASTGPRTDGRWPRDPDLSPAPSPVLAALLSLFIPGLGQAYAGHRLRGVIIAIPQLVVLLSLALVWSSSDRFALIDLGVRYSLAIAVVNVALLGYRALAIADAFGLAAERRKVGPSRKAVASGMIGLGLILISGAAFQGYLAIASYQLNRTVESAINCRPDSILPTRGCPTAVSAPRPSGLPERSPLATERPVSGAEDVASAAPSAGPSAFVPPAAASSAEPSDPPPTSSGSPVPAPLPYWAEDGMLAILMIGADAGPGRVGLRTDSLHVGLVDLASMNSAIVAIPRNAGGLALPEEAGGGNWNCSCFPQFITNLYTYADLHPDQFPGGPARGFMAVQAAVAATLELQIDGIVAVDLRGFVRAIDAIGGIEVTVPAAVRDEQYPLEDGGGSIDLFIPAGRQHMDGHTALAYARSRRQDSDYQRIDRQQVVLKALRREVTACRVVTRLPELLASLENAVLTDIPIEEVAPILEVVSGATQPVTLAFTPRYGFADTDARSELQREHWRTALRKALETGPPARTDRSEPTEPVGGC